MISVWIWALTMGTLLPGTVAAFWLVNRYAGHFLEGSSTPCDEGTLVDERVHDRMADEPSFSEMSSAEIDNIIEYYEKRR